MEQIYIFHLQYYDQSPNHGRQIAEMNHNQHSRCTEIVIDVLSNNYDSALSQAKIEYRKKNPCNVFGSTRPIRVVHWENG